MYGACMKIIYSGIDLCFTLKQRSLAVRKEKKSCLVLCMPNIAVDSSVKKGARLCFTLGLGFMTCVCIEEK